MPKKSNIIGIPNVFEVRILSIFLSVFFELRVKVVTFFPTCSHCFTIEDTIIFFIFSLDDFKEFTFIALALKILLFMFCIMVSS